MSARETSLTIRHNVTTLGESGAAGRLDRVRPAGQHFSYRGTYLLGVPRVVLWHASQGGWWQSVPEFSQLVDARRIIGGPDPVADVGLPASLYSPSPVDNLLLLEVRGSKFFIYSNDPRPQ